MEAVDLKVHPDAAPMDGSHIQDGCAVGARTKIWQFASVIRNAEIGDDCVIAAGACIDGARIGNRVHVGHCAFIVPGTVIGDDVFIGPFASICNDAWPSTSKDGFDLDKILQGRTAIVRIGKGAAIGAHAVILPGITIGECAMIAAGVNVIKDVPAGHIFYRDGRIEMIDPKRPKHRMRTI